MSKIAIYPGSFDPVTYGHLDIIKRSLKIFDKVIVSIVQHPQKVPLFTLEERVRMFTLSTKSLNNVKIATFEGLLVNYVKSQKTNIIIRGLRFISDFEYEMQIGLMNRRLNNSIETVFFMPEEHYSYLSSSLVKEIFLAGGEVDEFVPPVVKKALDKKFSLTNAVNRGKLQI